MKKTLIATAVSTALMAPIAVQAEPEVTVYGRVHQGIKLVDPDMGKSTTDFVGIGSRFGIKASSDLGNGMTASAQYEFATSSDKPGTGVASTRVAKVGVSGPFGSVDLGNQWGAYYNLVGVHVDPTFSVGGALYYLEAGPLRTANTIKYSNSFGPVSLELDARADDAGEQGGDGYAIGVGFALNDNISFAAGGDDNDHRTVTGAGVRVSFGNYWASYAHHAVEREAMPAMAAVPSDVTTTPITLGKAAVAAVTAADIKTNQIWLGGSFGNTSAMLGFGNGDMGGNSDTPGNDPSDVTLAVYHNMGGGLKLLYEAISQDVDDGPGKVDSVTHLFGIRLDF